MSGEGEASAAALRESLVDYFGTIGLDPTNESLTVTQFVEAAEHAGFSYNTSSLIELLPPDTSLPDAVTFDQAFDMLRRADFLESRATKIDKSVYLPAHVFFRLKCGCLSEAEALRLGSRRKGLESNISKARTEGDTSEASASGASNVVYTFHLDSSSVKPDAKTLLFLSTCAVLVCMWVGILLVMGVLWERNSLQRQSEHAFNSDQLLYLFGTGIEQRLVEMRLENQEDIAETLSEAAERLWTLKQEEILVRLEDLAVNAAADANAASSFTMQSYEELLDLSLSAVVSIASSDLGVSRDVVAKIFEEAALQLPKGSHGVIFQDDQTVLAAHNVNPRIHNLSKLCNSVDASSGGGIARTAYLEHFNVYVCLVIPPELLRSMVCADVRELFFAQAKALREDMHQTEFIHSTETILLLNRPCDGTIANPLSQIPRGIRSNVSSSHMAFGHIRTNLSKWHLLWQPRESFSKCELLVKSANFTALKPCTDFFQWVHESHHYRLNVSLVAGEIFSRHRKLKSFSSREVFAALTYASEADMYIVTLVPVEDEIAQLRQQNIDIFNEINGQLSPQIELSVVAKVSQVERATAYSIPSSNEKRNTTLFPLRSCTNDCFSVLTEAKAERECFAECSVTDAMRAHFGQTFFKRTSAAVLPDYKPKPVVAGFANPQKDLKLTFMLTRDVEYCQQETARSVSRLLGVANDNLDDVTFHLVKENGTKYNRLFGGSWDCPLTAHCLSIPTSEGSNELVVYRSDCPYCSVWLNEGQIGEVDSLANPPFEVLPSWKNVIIRDYRNPLGVTKVSSGASSSSFRLRKRTTWKNDPIATTLSGIDNLTAAIEMRMNLAPTQKEVRDGIFIAFGITLCVIVVALVLLIIQLRRLSSKFESTKQNMEEDLEVRRQKFYDLQAKTMPNNVAKLMASKSSIHESMASETGNYNDFHSQASVAFCDILSFSDICRGWKPLHVVRYVGYFSMICEELAKYCKLARASRFGDVVVVVGGIDGGDNIQDQQNGVKNVARYAGFLIQIVSKDYVHKPWLLREMSHAYATDPPDETTKHKGLLMPEIRIGLHAGPLFSNMISLGKAQFFNVSGVSLFLASRMQLTAPPGRIHVSVQFKERLFAIDYDEMFDYEPQRKTVLSSSATINSYFVRSVYLPVPEDLFSFFRIQPSQEPLQLKVPGEEDGTGTGEFRAPGATGSIVSGTQHTFSEASLATPGDASVDTGIYPV